MIELILKADFLLVELIWWLLGIKTSSFYRPTRPGRSHWKSSQVARFRSTVLNQALSRFLLSRMDASRGLVSSWEERQSLESTEPVFHLSSEALIGTLTEGGQQDWINFAILWAMGLSICILTWMVNRFHIHRPNLCSSSSIFILHPIIIINCLGLSSISLLSNPLICFN